MVVLVFSETEISAKLASAHKGFQLNGYTHVFQIPYHEDSAVGFAWTLTIADKGSIYLKMFNPSSDEFCLHSGTHIGTFHSISENEQDDVVTDKCMNNVNIQDTSEPRSISMPISLVLPDLSNIELSEVQEVLKIC